MANLTNEEISLIAQQVKTMLLEEATDVGNLETTENFDAATSLPMVQGNTLKKVGVKSYLDRIEWDISGRIIPWFGRKWVKGYSSLVGTPIGDIDLGTVLAHELGLGGYLVQNNHTRTKLKASNHNLLDNGGAADLTGAAGHYHWGWNAPFFYQRYEDETYEYETISLGGPRRGYWNYYIPVGSRSCAGYATMDRTNSILKSVVNNTEQFRGGNNDSSKDGAWNSLLGLPATVMMISGFRDAARRNGTLWFANERVMQFVTAMLKRIIFGNRNIQAAFNPTLDANGLRQGGTGIGADLPSNWGNWGYYPYIPLSAGVEQGDLTGIFSATINDEGTQRTINNIPSFYGLKNDYKYLYCMSENMLLECNADGSQSLFIDDNIDGSLMNLSSVAGLRKVATSPAQASGAWIWPKKYKMDHLSFFPEEDGGSGSTYYGDGYYNPAATSGLRGAGLLGGADVGGLAGSLYLDGNDGVGGAYAHWGAFLCEWAEAFSTEPVFCSEG